MIEIIISVLVILVTFAVIHVAVWLLKLPFRALGAGVRWMESFAEPPKPETARVITEWSSPMRAITIRDHELVYEQVMEIPLPGEVIPVTCGFCLGGLRECSYFWVCEHCGTYLHFECYQESGGCTTFGCKGKEGKTVKSLSAPAGY